MLQSPKLTLTWQEARLQKSKSSSNRSGSVSGRVIFRGQGQPVKALWVPFYHLSQPDIATGDSYVKKMPRLKYGPVQCAPHFFEYFSLPLGIISTEWYNLSIRYCRTPFFVQHWSLKWVCKLSQSLRKPFYSHFYYCGHGCSGTWRLPFYRGLAHPRHCGLRDIL